MDQLVDVAIDAITVEQRGEAVHVSIPSAGITFIRRNDRLTLAVDGDLYLVATGEIGVMTDGRNISIDSVQAKLLLNCRQSKPLRDLASSRKYLESMAQAQRQQNQSEHWPLYDLIGDLRKRVDDLENSIRPPAARGE